MAEAASHSAAKLRVLFLCTHNSARTQMAEGLLRQIIDHPPEVQESPAAPSLARVHGRVRFVDVTFGYPGTSRSALEIVSFEIEPGQLVALAGPSGVGKLIALSELTLGGLCPPLPGRQAR